MATPPVFTAGQVLTTAHMNAVGLWLIKTQTVGTAVSSVTVTGAFSSDYDNYIITYAGGTMSVDTAITLKVGTAVTNYYGVYSYSTWGSTTANTVTDNNNIHWTYAGGRGQFEVTLLSPYLTKQTVIYSRSTFSNNAGVYTGVEGTSTSHTQFIVAPVSGTITGGTIRVYGYRN
jgi:hypothetical protein